MTDIKFALIPAALALATMTVVAAEPVKECATAPVNISIEVNGKQLTVADLESKRPGALFQARNTYFEAQRKAMEEYVDDFLLEQQAAKENVTVAALLNKHVDAKLPPPPSEEALRVYFEGVDTTETFEAVKPKIIEALKERRKAKLRKEYMASLRGQSTIAVRVAPPRATIRIDNAPYRGPAEAPVVLVEYADYECPYCQQIQPALKQLEAEFKGKIGFVYKDVPLQMHPNAQKAAEAGRCALAQGKYWEFHDELLERKQLAVADLKKLARDLRIDGAAFDQCLDSGAKAADVRVHLEEAQSLGIQGTPSFFLNGRSFNGTPGYEQLRATIEEELARVSPAGRQAASR